MKFKAEFFISLKESILDPQGKTVNNALHHMGYTRVEKTRIGKYITLELDAPDLKIAEANAKEMADKILTNPIMEQYHFQLVQK